MSDNHITLEKVDYDIDKYQKLMEAKIMAKIKSDEFEKLNRPREGLNFGAAIEALKSGKKASRLGWNGKGMFLFLVAGSTFKVNRPPLLGIYTEGTIIDYRPHIDMKTVDGEIVPWVASQTDILAEDWGII